MIRFLIYTSILSLIAFSSSAQQTGITAIPDTNIILIGQQINVGISVTAKKNDAIGLPIFIDSLGKGLEIVKQTNWDTLKNTHKLSLTKTVTITSWDSGYYTVPPIPVIIAGDTLRSKVFLVAVADVPIDSTNAITDIKEIIKDPLTWNDYFDVYWPYAAGFGLACILIGLIVLLYQKFRKKPILVEPPKPITPAHIIALGKLKTLENEKLWQNNRTKQYHVELSEILREYIENRYKILSLEQTTEEIMHYLRLSDLNENQKQSLRKILMLTDLVKFAKELPLSDENEQIIVEAYSFIEQTKVIDIQPELNPNN